MQAYKQSFYSRYVKRPLDIVLAFVALLVLSPIFLIVTLLVRVNLGSPVIFKQNRPGKDEQIFTLYKFRTMTEERDEHGKLLPNSLRLTKFGQFLRTTSLDELPELFNILKGDMSIIGPRPLVVEYLPYYTDQERIRHSVRPGLSGLAQINGRNTIFWESRFSFDIEYVKTISFFNDLKIILKTIKQVIKRSDIGQSGVDAPIDFDEYRQRKLEMSDL